MSRDAANMRQQAAQGVAEVVQEGVSYLLNREGRCGVAQAIHFACNTAIGALTVVVPFLAQRPTLSRDEVAKVGHNELVKLMNPDTVLFAALITAKMFVGAALDQSNDRYNKDGDHETAIAQEINFGPAILAEALEDWKKLTNRNPVGILDKNILDAIAEVTRGSTAPFDELLENRRKANQSPSSKTLQ